MENRDKNKGDGGMGARSKDLTVEEAGSTRRGDVQSRLEEDDAETTEGPAEETCTQKLFWNDMDDQEYYGKDDLFFVQPFEGIYAIAVTCIVLLVPIVCDEYSTATLKRPRSSSIDYKLLL